MIEPRRLLRTLTRIASVPLAGLLGGLLPGAIILAVMHLARSTGYSPEPPRDFSALLETLLVGSASGAVFGVFLAPFGYCSALAFYSPRAWLRFAPLPLAGTVLAGGFTALGGPLLAAICAFLGYISTSVVAWRLLRLEASPRPA